MIVFLSSSILVSMDSSFQLLLASKLVHLASSGVHSYLTSGAVIIVEPPLFISVCLCVCVWVKSGLLLRAESHCWVSHYLSSLIDCVHTYTHAPLAVNVSQHTGLPPRLVWTEQLQEGDGAR